LLIEKLKELIHDTWEHELEMVEYILRDPMLYGDFRNACNEGEPRFYEDLLDYEAVYNLFLEVRLHRDCHDGSINFPRCQFCVDLYRSIFNSYLQYRLFLLSSL